MKLLLLILLLPIAQSTALASELEEKLSGIQAITFSKINTAKGFKECYRILIKQPIDHQHPEAGTFWQKVYLSHRSFQGPMLLFVNGYVANNNTINEWSNLLNTNQILVESRYFGESKPDSMDWDQLNMKNVAADLHHIKMVFEKLYPNKWISTGTSKGGLTAVTHKFFFPEDVDATIAHSTSIKQACDTTLFTYIDSLSASHGCYETMKSFQKQLLLRKTALLPLLKNYFDKSEKGYDRLGLETIFETAVLEIPFSIWQNGWGCQTVSRLDTSSTNGMFTSFRSSIYHWFLTDDVFEEIDAYHYQALTELGYYCYPTIGLADLINDTASAVTSVYPPENVPVQYSDTLMIALKEWLVYQGSHIIYISGENDPYTARRIKTNAQSNSLSIVLEGKNHNQIHFSDLSSQQKEQVLHQVKLWLK